MELTLTRRALACIVSLTLFMALGSASATAGPPVSNGIPRSAAQALADMLDHLAPFETPSAAGELAMLRDAGFDLGSEDGGHGIAGTEAEASPDASGGDVVANDPTTDTGNSTTQSETTLSVNGTTVCAGYNDSSAAGLSGLSRSTDRGDTWTDLGGLATGSNGDPVLALHRATGTFYYAENASVGGNTAIGVAISTDDCQTFAAPVNASPGASAIPTTTLNDKPWIAVDNTGGARDGDLYVCWTRFDSVAASELRFSRSTDGGATWVNEQIIQLGGTAPFGCSMQVGPTGQVYVAWADRAGATANDIRFRSSTDGGLTFSVAQSVSTGNVHPGNDTIVNCGPNNNRPTLTGNIRMLHQAWLAVDTTGGPNNGNLYAVWASDPAGTPDNSDVFFSRSTDQGATWSPATQIGGGGGATDQFEPFVAVGGTGQVVIAWYDRRNDVANNTNVDLYTTFSQDGGATIDPIVRVTDQSFGVPQLNPNFDPRITNCYMGEYIAVATDASRAYYLWGDNRNTVTNAQWPTGRPDPDVFFDTLGLPGANQAPSADANGPYNTQEGTDVALDGTGSSDPDGDTLTYEWDLDDDGQFDDATGATPNFDRVGQDGVLNIALRVTDPDGESDSDSTTVTVTNVAPSISGLSTDGPVDENSPVTLSATIRDPGWLDDLSATVDWDDGNGPQAVTGTEENTRPDATLELAVPFIYGDDGAFTAELCGSDDDTTVCQSTSIQVDNVDPTADIDDSGGTDVNGVKTIFAHAGEDITFDGNSTDPGSDDLALTWDWDDGPPVPDVAVFSLVNPPLTDPDPSPDVNPRDVDDQQIHAFGEACLYEIVFASADDDGGSASDDANVIITGNATKVRPQGYWQKQLDQIPPQDFSDEELECFLAITGYLSQVFNEERDASTVPAAYEVIFVGKNQDSAAQKLDRQLLTAWLNLANGSIGYLQPVDTDEDGVNDSTVAEALGQAETVRLDPTSTDAQLEMQRTIVHRFGG